MKQIVLENRNTKQITYIDIQKQFHLVDKVTYDTPELCDDLIKKKSRECNQLNRNKLSKEIF